ncbi:MAG: response regulator [Candidatus Eremiobacteraeota bacterium]|nr:response regulator [Candidatus Eremiobacteraeota bacterium]MCW5868685.1 response regulator [Candidatus Eremiobacteraeota bacterium]
MQENIQVLVLEDDLGLLNTLVEALTDCGFTVRSTSDSSKAVELSLEYDFDIIVTDIRMSGMDGLQALAKVQEWSPDVCSLVITGFASETDTLRALRLGVGEYLLKPFTVEDLQAAIDRLVVKVQNKRRAAAHEASLLGFLRWSLAGFAASPAVEQKCPWALPAAEKARELAGYFSWDEPDTQALELASMCSNLARLGLPRELDQILPARVLSILQSPHGLESQLLEASEALAQGRQPSAHTPAAVLQAIEGGQAGPVGQTGRKRRSTLALALALEQSDQLAAAVQAYQSLAAPPPSPEGAKACLALAHLAGRLGRPDQVMTHCQQAVSISRSLGPVSLAESAYQAGLLLARLDPKVAGALLTEAEGIYQRLDFAGPAGLAHLAGDWLAGRELHGPSLAAQLGHPGDSLLAAATWLVPGLLESEEPRAPQLTQILLQQRPTLALELVKSEKLSARALLTLLQSPVSREVQELLLSHPSEQVRQTAQQLQAPGESDGAVPTLRIFSMGLQEIFHGQARLPETSFRRNQKARQLLTYLAWERGRVVSDDILAEIFWPQEGSRGRKNVYSVRSILRKALQPPGLTREIAYVCRQPQGLAMDRDLPWWHDVEELRSCLRSWESADRQGDSTSALAALRRAAELYRGPFLENCYLDWAVEARQQLDAQMTRALYRLAELLFQKKTEVGLAEALELGQRILELDACCQEAYALMMRVHLELHSPIEAIKLYERAHKALARELQVEPSLDLLRLHTEARLLL